MLDWLSKMWAQHARRAVSRPRPARLTRHKLGFDLLEQRELLAGDVTVAVSGAGDLQVTGDAAGNGIAIYRGQQAGQFVVARTDGSTLINGSTAPFVATGVTHDFNIDLGDGNNLLNMFNDVVPNDLIIGSVINTGNNIDNLSNVRVGGVLTVSGGDGNDQLNMFGVTVAGAVAVNQGNGNDAFRSSISNLQSTLTVTMGNGHDVVQTFGTVVGGATQVTLGNGDNDHVDLGFSRFKSSVNVNLGTGDRNSLSVLFNRFDTGITATVTGTNAVLVNHFNKLGGPVSFVGFAKTY
jgi:hypothetical protein